MIVASVLITVMNVLWAWLLSRQHALGALKDSMLNPFLVIVAYIVFVSCDFLAMAQSGYGHLAGATVRPDSAFDLFVVYIKVSALIASLLLGSTIALQWATVPRVPRASVAFNPTVTAIIFVAVLVAYCATQVLPALTMGLSLKSGVLIHSDVERNALKFAQTLLLTPALAYFIAGRRPRHVYPAVCFLLLAFALIGSRTRILYLLVPFAFYLHRYRGMVLSRRWFLVAIAVVLIGSFSYVNYRVYIAKGEVVRSVTDLISLSNIFYVNDSSFAEAAVSIARAPEGVLDPYPGEDIVGAVLASVPRSLVPFKPFGGSVQFTEWFDPIGWKLFNRGLTIGGINELLGDYPLLLGMGVAMLCGLLWTLALTRSAWLTDTRGFVDAVGLYLAAFAFLKADLQAAGQVLSVFLIMRLALVMIGARRRRAALDPRPTPQGIGHLSGRPLQAGRPLHDLGPASRPLR